MRHAVHMARRPKKKSDPEVEKRRARLKAFFDSFGKRQVNRVCIAAKINERVPREFMGGRNQSMELSAYLALARQSHWTIEELLGDAPIPTEQDILSRKNGNQTGTGNDSSTDVGQDTRSANEGAGGMETMSDRLLVEIFERVNQLPQKHLSILKEHVDRIAADPARPQSAGAAE